MKNHKLYLFSWLIKNVSGNQMMDLNRTGPNATVLFFHTPVTANKMELYRTTP